MNFKLPGKLRPRPKIAPDYSPTDKAAAPVSTSPSSRPSVLQEPVLVLNATFEPINVTAVRRALALVLKGIAQAEEHNHAEVHSASLKIGRSVRWSFRRSAISRTGTCATSRPGGR